MNILTRISAFIFGSILALSVVDNPVFADDTELYADASSSGENQLVPTNILFILDSSSSMNQEPGNMPFDPGKTYRGDCNPDYIYWSGVPIEPENVEWLCKSSGRYFKPDTVTCDAAMQVLNDRKNGAGHYRDYFKEFNPGDENWSSYISTSNRDADNVWRECKADLDSGTHGPNDDPATPQNESTEKPYPRHDDHKATIPGPWTDDPTKQEPIQSGDG
ncbi:MAG: hypothetical protein MJA83_04845, partial [Gammaproteobacteria bacterium]|nr:hypothetical protein [Gammaproteobacteria bacterium]